MIHNTVCGLLLGESKIYREIEMVNMWWTTIIVVALLAFGIVGFVSMVRLFEQRLTSDHPGSRRYVRPVRGFPAGTASTVLSPTPLLARSP